MKVNIDNSQAMMLAESICSLFAPYCQQIQIAGSLRREKKVVGDIEIVAQPLPEYDLFRSVCGYMQLPIKKLGGKVDMNGDRYKRIQIPLPTTTTILSPSLSCSSGLNNSSSTPPPYVSEGEVRYIQLDLFIVLPPARWGVILLDRTGPAGFSHRVVTKKVFGGYMPGDCYQVDGAVWRGGNCVGFDLEEDYLSFLGLGWVEPRDRKG